MSLMSGEGSRALVTGATGFVGALLCPTLAQHGWQWSASAAVLGRAPAPRGWKR